jgi:transcriptional regulator with XRE-family HTH domain
MKLDDFLTDRKSEEDFADALGVAHSTVWRWRTGKYIPNSEMIHKIRLHTKDAVRPSDWYGE